MIIGRDDERLLEKGITLTIDYDYDSEGVYIDEDKIREEFEEQLEELLEIDICKCGFCGEPLEHETRYCSRECAIADNSERV